MTDRMQTVQGRCPACGNTLLFLADGGHVTCSLDTCPNPSAADDVLHGSQQKALEQAQADVAELGRSVVEWAALAKRHQHWGQRRWNAWKSARGRAQRLAAELAVLRQVARGYCPACGRGDAAPTVADWEAERQRAERAEAERDHLAAAASPADVAVRAIQLMQEAGRERDELRAAVARVREYAATSDDDSIHTRQNILRIVGEWHGPETQPAPAAAQATEATNELPDPSWSVRCRPPGCNAQPGERCRRRDGSLSSVSHGERWREYDRQQAARAEATGHRYLSTGCLHGRHDYCKAMTGLNGAKRPAECKFCKAPCVCPCHQKQPDA